MGVPTKIVLATGNAGKLREIEALLAPLDIEVVSQNELGVRGADETGSSFEENALIKARHAAAETGLAAIADDSGLVVDALGGRPGVLSARYSGADANDESNIEHLLAELDGISDNLRSAAFHCVVCYLSSPDAEPLYAHGVWNGRILNARRGKGGFGYDPVFWDPELGLAAAELSATQKNARSHRGLALRELVSLIAKS